MQLVARFNADPRVMSSISSQSHTCLEIDHEIFFYAHSDPLADPRGLVSVPSKSMCTKY